LSGRLEPILDVNSTLRFIALLSLFSSLDSYIGNAHNYYLYDRDDTGQFVPLLWDANLAFNAYQMVFKPSETVFTLDPFPPTKIRDVAGQVPVNATLNLMLIKNVLSIEAYNRTYLRSMAQMLRGGFNVNSVNSRVQELAAIIRSSVYSDPNFLFNSTSFEEGLAGITRFVEARAIYLEIGVLHVTLTGTFYVNGKLNDFARKTDLRLNELTLAKEGAIRDSEGDLDPWVEIYNLGPGLVNAEELFLTDEPSVPNKWALPSQNVSDGGYLLMWLDGETDEGLNHVSFSLNPSGGELSLFARNGSSYDLVDRVFYPSLGANVSYGRCPDGEGSWVELKVCSLPMQPNQMEIPAGLFINELMADNKASIQGPDGKYPDWIELYNMGDKTVDLSGMYLTDDLANPMTWEFPMGTSIGANSYLLVWADKSTGSGVLHANFALDANGEKVGLFAADGKTNIDYVVFCEQFSDASCGRCLDGNSTWNYLAPTPGSANQLGPRSAGLNPTPSPSPTPTSPSQSTSPPNMPSSSSSNPSDIPVATSAPAKTPTFSSNFHSPPESTPTPSPTATMKQTQTPVPTPMPTPASSISISPSESQSTPEPATEPSKLPALVLAFFAVAVASAAGAAVLLRRKR
jgi:hypothetical protein